MRPKDMDYRGRCPQCGANEGGVASDPEPVPEMFQCQCCREEFDDLRVQAFENAPGQAALATLCEDCHAATSSEDPDEAIAAFRRCARMAAQNLPAHPGFPFPLGQVVVTLEVLEALTAAEVRAFLDRHALGDWGESCPASCAADNDFALTEERRVTSVYDSVCGLTFWVITEADRSATTVLFPEDD